MHMGLAPIIHVSSLFSFLITHEQAAISLFLSLQAWIHTFLQSFQSNSIYNCYVFIFIWENNVAFAQSPEEKRKFPNVVKRHNFRQYFILIFKMQKISMNKIRQPLHSSEQLELSSPWMLSPKSPAFESCVQSANIMNLSSLIFVYSKNPKNHTIYFFSGLFKSKHSISFKYGLISFKFMFVSVIKCFQIEHLDGAVSK